MIRRHRKELQPLTQINLTSMLDVAFVLLIAFMIVAPSIKFGIDLDLPTIQEGAPQLTQDQHKLYTIVVPKSVAGELPQMTMNGSPGTAAEFEQRLKLQKQTGGKVAVEIRADRDTTYEHFVQVVAAVRRAGIDAVGLPLEPPTGRGAAEEAEKGKVF